MKEDLKQFYNYLKNDKKLAQNTVESYGRDLEQYLTFLKNKKVTSFVNTNEETVNDFLLELKLKGRSSATLNRVVATLRSLYTYIEKTKTISSPVIKLSCHRVELKAPVTLTKEETLLLIQQPEVSELKGLRDKTMLQLMYLNGLKVSELLKLNVKNVNIDSGTVKIGKRTIQLSMPALEVLTKYLINTREIMIVNNNETALFVNTRGTRLTRQGFWKIVKFYKNQANIQKNITPETLRNSTVAHLKEQGVSNEYIQNF